MFLDYLTSPEFFLFLDVHLPYNGINDSDVIAALAIFSALALFQLLTGVPLGNHYILTEVFSRLHMDVDVIPGIMLQPYFLL
jgi:hypothetical protein